MLQYVFYFCFHVVNVLLMLQIETVEVNIFDNNFFNVNILFSFVNRVFCHLRFSYEVLVLYKR
jgi:hypothetical protein